MVYTNYPNLADHLRKWGLNVQEVAGWQSRSANSTTFTPIAVMAHHTAGSAEGNAPTLNYIRNNNLAQFVLGRDGTVYLNSGNRQNHAGLGGPHSGIPKDAGNRYSWGIEAENTGRGEPWSEKQLNAYYRLCASLLALMGKTASSVLAHKEWAPTRKIDPAGLDMDAFRRNVAAALAAGPSGNTPSTGDPVLREGDSGHAVMNVQNALIKHGHKIAADGDFGPATKSAVCAFQKAMGLAVDGVVGQNTWDALRKAPAPVEPAPTPTGETIPGTGDRWLGLMNPLLRGNDVKGVQNALSIANYMHPVDIDGVYGRGTAAAVVKFQQANGITERGVGPKTWAALRKVVHG